MNPCRVPGAYAAHHPAYTLEVGQLGDQVRLATNDPTHPASLLFFMTPMQAAQLAVALWRHALEVGERIGDDRLKLADIAGEAA